MMEFISEEDLETFEGWLKYQAVEPSTADEFETWRRLFEETRKLSATSPKVGLMKLQRAPGESRYAVAEAASGSRCGFAARRRASSSSCCRVAIGDGTSTRATTLTARST